MAISGSETISKNPAHSLWNKAFWVGAAERAIKTAAQTVAAAVTVDVATGGLGVDALSLDWLALLGLALGGAFYSLIFSISNPSFVAGVAEIVHVPEPVPGLSPDQGTAAVL